jgi:hypothetical protein
MKFTVEYEDGVWLFNVEASESEPHYMEEFDISNLADAQAAASDLIKEIREAYELGEEEEDEEEFTALVNDLDS